MHGHRWVGTRHHETRGSRVIDHARFCGQTWRDGSTSSVPLLGHHDPGVPSRGASTRRRVDRREVDAASSESPGHDRVRVPHLTGVRLIPTPDRSRDLRQHFEHASCAHERRGHTDWTSDCGANVRNLTVPPSPDLVAEDAKAISTSHAHWPFSNDAPRGAVGTGYGCLFHDESALGNLHDQCRVVEIATGSARRQGRQRFEDLPADPHNVGTCSERYPIQIDRGGVAPGGAHDHVRRVGCEVHRQVGCCSARSRMVRRVARKMWVTNGRMTDQ